MAAKWIVHKGDEQLSPMDAYEIREGLRSGEIGPFDQVNLEGSPFMRTVIEVDEIFDTGQVVLEDVSGTVLDQPDIVPFEEEKKPEKRPELFLADPSIIGSPGKFTPSHAKKKSGLSGITQRFGKNKPSTVDFLPKQRKRPPTPKGSRYRIVYGSGKQSDLMSPEKIVSTFKRGVLDKNVKVVKNGSSKKIDIVKFVATYDPAAAVAKGNRGKVARAGRNIATNIGILSSSSSKFLLIGLIVLIIVGVGGFIAYKRTSKSPKLDPQPQVKFRQQPSSFRIGGSGRDSQEQVSGSSGRLRRGDGKRSSRRRKVKKTGFYSIASAKKSGKKVVTIGPLSYRRVALSRCKGKCDLVFYDKEKGKVNVVFFKAKFGDKLQKKTTGVYMTGLVLPNGKIALQDVR